MMLLKTKWEIMKDYESRGMLNTNAALQALNTNKETASHTIANEDSIRYVNMLVFAHVEGPTIAKEITESRSKCSPSEIITRRYYKTVLNTDLDMEVMSENARQGMYYTTERYLKAREKYEQTA